MPNENYIEGILTKSGLEDISKATLKKGVSGTPVIVNTKPGKQHANMPTVEDVKEIHKQEVKLEPLTDGLIGSDLIVVDKTEQGEKVQIRADQKLKNAITYKYVPATLTEQGTTIIVESDENIELLSTNHGLVNCEISTTEERFSISFVTSPTVDETICYAGGRAVIDGDFYDAECSVDSEGKVTIYIIGYSGDATFDEASIGYLVYNEEE